MNWMKNKEFRSHRKKNASITNDELSTQGSKLVSEFFFWINKDLNNSTESKETRELKKAFEKAFRRSVSPH